MSEVTALPLRPSHSFVMPSVVWQVPQPKSSRPQSWLPLKLPRCGEAVSAGSDKKAGGYIRCDAGKAG